MNNDFYTMWLTSIQGLKRKQIISLIEKFGTPENIWNASIPELKTLKVLKDDAIALIVKSKDISKLEDTYYSMEDRGIRYISIFNKEYPYLLSKIYDPPFGLYIRGRLPDENFKKVAVIGARRCTSYGAIVAEKLSKEMASKNIVIVSGMARGIDSMAHSGALDVGGKTIAVLGCGVDICYPPENIGLMERIIESGCIISEYPLGTPPLNTNFPQRNRIISGLCEGIVVIEAEKRSGTLITVHQALDNGRTVFAVPGNITSVSSEGTNELIKEGATMVTSVDDIFFELNINENLSNNNDECENNVKYTVNLPKDLEEDEKNVYDCIKMEPIDVETITITLNESIQNVQYILTMLELKGYIRKINGDKYIREF